MDSALAPKPRQTIALVAISMVIGFCLPFDALVNGVAGGNRLAHALVMGALALAGVRLSVLAGFRLEGHTHAANGAARPWQVGMFWALAVTLYVLALDGIVFPTHLSAPVVARAQLPLAERLPYFMARAFNENVIYRLVVFAALVAAARGLRGGRAVPWPGILAAATVAQLVNIGANVMWLLPEQWSLAGLGYDLIRYVVPGVLWAWLYRQHGFATAEVASVGCHIFLQPAMVWLV